MRIVYNHQAFSGQRYGGVSRYFHELATRVASEEGVDATLLAPAYVNRYVRENGDLPVVGSPVPEIPRTGRLRQLVNHHLSRAWLRRNPPDVLHETGYWSHGSVPERTRTVVTVYDMIHELFPEFFPGRQRIPQAKAEAVRRADHVVCISENTRNDLLRLLDVDPGKVSVIHLGATLSRAVPPSGSSPVSGPYLLHVGHRGGYKNFRSVAQAVGGSPSLRGKVRIVCFGGEPFTRGEWRAIHETGLREGDVVSLRGDDHTLATLYAHAAAFVYPSLYEGFGLPPLEAMSYGCPVLCSNGGSLPEVVGPACEMFDPRSIEGIAAAAETVLGSPERAALLRSLGAERLKHFSWDRCAEQTCSVYRSLV